MAMTLSAARAAVQAQLAAAIPSLRCYATVPGQVNPPAAVVAPNTGDLADYEVAMSSGITVWQIRIILVVATAVDRAAQNKMDAFLGTSGTLSIPAAIRADPTLGGVAEWCVVKTAQRYGMMQYQGVDYLGCELLCEVSG